MNPYYKEFIDYLNQEDKEKAVTYAIQLLSDQKVNIETLYLELLAPSLHDFMCQEKDEEVCVWKEHLRTSIIRTILENCYLFILERTKKIKKISGKVVVLTPAFELHEIGAIMNAHFMMLEGLDASYIGANTPKGDILSAIRAYEPKYIAISVTNPYNLVITKQITDDIRRFFPEVKIILGGQAFKEQHALTNLQYDYILQTIDDLKRFVREVSA